MKTVLAAFLSVLAMNAMAQSTARSLPSGAVPLDAPPPPPALVESDPALEKQTTTTTRIDGEQTVEEYRVNGKIVMQRVTPRHGRPYVLRDSKGDGTFTKQDNTLDNGVRVPQWVLLEF